MAKNETNVTEKKTTAAVAETLETEIEKTVPNLLIHRKRYRSKTDGKEYWEYFASGKVRGRDIHVDFMAKDKGGYEVLDIVFEILGTNTAELLMREEKQYDEKTGMKKFTVYEVQNIDENGIPFRCGIKPSRDSDKSLLQMLITQLAVENALQMTIAK